MQKFFKHPWAIIIVTLVLTAFFGFQLKNAVLDNSTKQYLPQKHESYKRLEETKDQFGSMASIGVSLETDGDTILTPENIAIVQKITERVEKAHFIDEVTSLTNIDYISGKDGGMNAEKLIPADYTGSSADMETLRKKLSDWGDMYNRVIISDDGKATQMQFVVHDASAAELKQLHTTSAQEMDVALTEVKQIVNEEIKGSGLMMKIYGEPVVSADARDFMLSDLEALIPLVIVVVLLSLFFSFHTLDGTVLPLIAVVISTEWACGLMAMLHITFTVVSSVIPVALIACGSAYGIHVLTHYYIALDATIADLKQKGLPMTKEKHLEAICAGLKDVWMAVMLAAVTTVVGFISLVSSPIGPLHSFAIFTAIGIAFSLILSVTLIPALLYTKSEKAIGKRSRTMDKLTAKVKKHMETATEKSASQAGNRPKQGMGTTLYNIYMFLAGTKPRLILFSLLIIGFSWAGVRKMVIDTAIVSYFAPDSQLRQDINYVDKRFAGTNSVYFLIESPASFPKKEADKIMDQVAALKAKTDKDGKVSDKVQKQIDDLTAKANDLYAKSKTLPDMTNPDALKPLDDMEHYLENKYDAVGKVVSFNTFVKRMNQVMHVPSAAATAPAAEPVSSGESIESFGDDFGSDFSSDFGTDTSASAAPAAASTFVDPNIAYSEKLQKTMTTQEALDMLKDAYDKAGGKRATVDEIVKILQSDLNYNGTDYYEIPTDTTKYPVASKEELANLVSQYLLLYSGSLDRFADSTPNPTVVRTMVQLRNHSTDTTGVILADAREYAAKHFPEGYKLEATGTGEMEYTMTDMVVSSQMSSLIFSLLSVFIIIAIAFKSALAGLVGAIPLAFTIILNYMIMGFCGIKLDLITSIIASVAIGVGIDYTIHFLTTYCEERKKSADLEQVTRTTFNKSGLGIITNALAVGLGFLVLYFSKFIVLRYIGVLVAIVMFSSSFLAMTVIPGVLNAFDPKFTRPKKEEKKESK